MPPKAEKKSKPVKAPKEPKAPKEKKPSSPSAYIIFCKEERNGIVAANPEASFGEVGKLLGEKWKSLSDAQKAPFQKKAADAKAALTA